MKKSFAISAAVAACGFLDVSGASKEGFGPVDLAQSVTMMWYESPAKKWTDALSINLPERFVMYWTAGGKSAVMARHEDNDVWLTKRHDATPVGILLSSGNDAYAADKKKSGLKEPTDCPQGNCRSLRRCLNVPCKN